MSQGTTNSAVSQESPKSKPAKALTLKKIAKELGVTDTKVKSWLRKLGIRWKLYVAAENRSGRVTHMNGITIEELGGMLDAVIKGDFNAPAGKKMKIKCPYSVIQRLDSMGDGYYCDVDLVPRITVVVDTIVKSRTFEQINELSDKNMDKPIFQAMRELWCNMGYHEDKKAEKELLYKVREAHGWDGEMAQSLLPIGLMCEETHVLEDGTTIECHASEGHEGDHWSGSVEWSQGVRYIAEQALQELKVGEVKLCGQTTEIRGQTVRCGLVEGHEDTHHGLTAEESHAFWPIPLRTHKENTNG